GERAVTVVLVKAVGAPRRRTLDLRATRHEEIEPAVVVVVEERDPAAVGLENVLLPVRVAVNDGGGEARPGRNVRELEGRLGGAQGTRKEPRHCQKIAPVHLTPFPSTTV